MHESPSRDWPPLITALLGTIFVLALASSPRVLASDRLFQTVPTPTPRTVPTPAKVVTPRPAQEEAPARGDLAVRQAASPQDVLPGDTLEFTLWLSNTSNVAVTGIILTDALDPFLSLLEVRATQGAVRIEDGSLYVHVGSLEPGQTGLLILRAQVGTDAQDGHIILNQFTVFHDTGEVKSNIVAASLPPDVLPGTGQEGRGQ